MPDRDRPAYPQIVCLGEAVVDELGSDGAPHLGGSPANVAVGLHRHGVPVRLWSRVGEDAEGWFVREALARAGVPADLVVDPLHPTRVVRILEAADGTRRVQIRTPDTADQYLQADDYDRAVLEQAGMLYLTAVPLLHDVSAAAAQALVEAARARGALIVFDPNIRLRPERARPAVRQRLDAMLARADVVKTSADTWANLWGTRTPADLLDAGPSLVIETRGAAGVWLQTPRHGVAVPAPRVDPVVDTTGAGDAFLAAFLARLWPALGGGSPAEPSIGDLHDAAVLGHHWAGLILRHRGAVTGYDAEPPADGAEQGL
ncbi:MAG: hypothetical protein D6685_00440 [Bacteroidetes bacterium]|nr:MAG: hypothetical protein D6685_00440 [Bacteroidota bacterium]